MKKRLTWKLGLSLVVGVLCGWWAADKLPLLRGGVRFEPAPSIDEQMAKRRSILQPRKNGSELPTVRSVEPAYLRMRSWKARTALLGESVHELLPERWEEALRILMTYRDAHGQVDGQLLVEIFKAGGDAAFEAAVASNVVGGYALGTALRLSDLPNKAALIEGYVSTSSEPMEDLASFIMTAATGDETDLESTVAAAALLRERFGGEGLINLAESMIDAGHLEESDERARHDAIEMLMPLAETPYVQSVVAYHMRMAGRSTYETTPDNPELSSVSEIHSHLSVETNGRLRANGQEATLQWAMTEVPETFRERVTGNVFHRATFDGDDLKPLLLALNLEATGAAPDLVRQAIESAEKASRFRTPSKKRAKQETYEVIQRMAGDRDEVMTLLRQFEGAIER